MKNSKYFAFIAVIAACLMLSATKMSSAPNPKAQVAVNIGVAPDCPYGYYDYAPYACAPYGYYGFQSGSAEASSSEPAPGSTGTNISPAT